jgi:adenylate cyclase class 2
MKNRKTLRWLGGIMAFEIELKARLDGPEPTKQRLAAAGRYCRSYIKTDTYWRLPAGGENSGLPPSGVRVRRESGVDAEGRSHKAVLVTFKTKEASAGVEVNNEREFTVSDAAVFEELLGRLGLEPAVRKEKRGQAWTIGGSGGNGPAAPILAELSDVTDLGWFIEIEILADDDDAETVARCRERLFALLGQLGITRDAIEERPYTQMLRRIGLL